MRLALLLLACAVGGAPFARAQDNSDFPQTQGRSGGGGSGGDDGNSWRSDQMQTEAAAEREAPPPMPSPPPDGSNRQGDAPRKRGGRNSKGSSGSNDNGGGNSNGMNRSNREDGSNGSDGDGSEQAGDEQGGDRGEDLPPADFETARQNFAALVESYVAKRSGKGYWSYVEKKGRKARRLVEPSVDEESVRVVGTGRYTALVTLRDEGARKPFQLEFTADFSGIHWKIVGVKSAPARGRK